jgi:hypothetical protein
MPKIGPGGFVSLTGPFAIQALWRKEIKRHFPQPALGMRIPRNPWQMGCVKGLIRKYEDHNTFFGHTHQLLGMEGRDTHLVMRATSLSAALIFAILLI